MGVSASEGGRTIIAGLATGLAKDAGRGIVTHVTLKCSLTSNEEFAGRRFKLCSSRNGRCGSRVLFSPSLGSFCVTLIYRTCKVPGGSRGVPGCVGLRVSRKLRGVGCLFRGGPRCAFFSFLVRGVNGNVSTVRSTPVSLSPIRGLGLRVRGRRFSNPVGVGIKCSPTRRRPICFYFGSSKGCDGRRVTVTKGSNSKGARFTVRLVGRFCRRARKGLGFLFLSFGKMDRSSGDGVGSFFRTARARYVYTPGRPFPLGPVSFVSGMGRGGGVINVGGFISVVTGCSGVNGGRRRALESTAQRTFLRRAKNGRPSFSSVGARLLRLMKSAHSALASVVNELDRCRLFRSGVGSPDDFLGGGCCFSLSKRLSGAMHFASMFLVVGCVFGIFAGLKKARIASKCHGVHCILVVSRTRSLFERGGSLRVLRILLHGVHSCKISIILLSRKVSRCGRKAFSFSRRYRATFLLPVGSLTGDGTVGGFLKLSRGSNTGNVEGVRGLRGNLTMSGVGRCPGARVFRVIRC